MICHNDASAGEFATSLFQIAPHLHYRGILTDEEINEILSEENLEERNDIFLDLMETREPGELRSECPTISPTGIGPKYAQGENRVYKRFCCRFLIRTIGTFNLWNINIADLEQFFGEPGINLGAEGDYMLRLVEKNAQWPEVLLLHSGNPPTPS